MRRIISALIVFLLVFQVATPVFAATQTARNIVIFEVEGEEATMTRGAARSFAARANQRMGNGYTISTGRDSFVWLLLDEDSVVKIDQNSKIQFGNARGNNLSISVLSGAITTNTAAQSAGNSVNVRAGNSALAVRGTLFVVENLPDNRVVITMLAGSGSVNDIPLEAGEFLQIFDTESERVYETQTLVIDQELSLSVLTAILDNISYVIEAGLIDTEAAEIVIAQVEELMQEAIEALEEERAARDAEIEAEAEAAPPVPEPTTPAATPPVTEPETEPPTEPPTTPPPTEPPTTPPPTTPPPTEPPTEPPPNPDDVAIAGARAAIEGAVFGAIQANVGNVDQARAVVQGVLDGLELHGTAVEIVDGAFTAATAGNATTPNGTNGSFTFTAEINKTAGTQQITNQLTLTITATPYDPSIQANIDITNARIAIEAATFSATQANVGDIAQARAAVQAVLDGLNLHGTATEIVDGTFANATAGTATNPAGTGGSFAFTVEINKTAGTQQTTNQQTLTISATPYDPSIQANIDITNARIAIQAATFAAIQANVGDVAQARAAVQAVLDGLNLHGTATEIVDGTFANATAGTATTPNGINGSFAFTVEINKTAGTQQITNQLTLTITATPYDPSIQANIDITNARIAIEGATFSATQANVGDTTQARASVQAVLDGLNLHGTTTEIIDNTFTPATAGTATDPTGTNGSFTFTININRTGGTQQTTPQRTLTIYATPYTPPPITNVAELIAALQNASAGDIVSMTQSLTIGVGDMIPVSNGVILFIPPGITLSGTATAPDNFNPGGIGIIGNNSSIIGNANNFFNFGGNAVAPPLYGTINLPMGGGLVDIYMWDATIQADGGWMQALIDNAQAPGILNDGGSLRLLVNIDIGENTTIAAGQHLTLANGATFRVGGFMNTALTVSGTLNILAGGGVVGSSDSDSSINLPLGGQITFADTANRNFFDASGNLIAGDIDGPAEFVWNIANSRWQPPPSPDDIAITNARAAIEGATFTATQANVGDIAQARVAIQAVLDGLDLYGTTAEIVNGIFTAATAGTATDPAGTDGSFTFTVNINRGTGTQQITNQLTLTITATPYDPSIQANIDITNARIAIQGATFTASQANVGNIDQARTAVQAILDGLNLHGTTTEIVNGGFATATAGTAAMPNGIDGSFGFSVEIDKTAGTQQTTNNLYLIINATRFTDDDFITGAREFLEEMLELLHDPSQAEVGNATQAAEWVQDFLDDPDVATPLDDSYGVTVTLVPGAFVPPTAGTAMFPNGMNGSFTFTVNVNRGTGTQQTTSQIMMFIIATPYNPDNTAITNARAFLEEAIDDFLHDPSQAEVDNATQAAEWVQDFLDDPDVATPLDDSYGVTVTLVPGAFVPPTAGTVTDPSGMNGSFTFTIEISRGTGTTQTTNPFTLTIYARPFDLHSALLSGDVTLSANLTIESGVNIPLGRTLTIAPTATLTMAGSAWLNVQGNLVVNGTLNSPTGTDIQSGAADSVITVNGTFNAVNLSVAELIINAAGTLDLNGGRLWSATGSNTITLNGGRITGRENQNLFDTDGTTPITGDITGNYIFEFVAGVGWVRQMPLTIAGIEAEFAAGRDVTLTSDFTLGPYVLDIPDGRTLTIGNDAIFTLEASSRLNVHGAFVVNGQVASLLGAYDAIQGDGMITIRGPVEVTGLRSGGLVVIEELGSLATFDREIIVNHLTIHGNLHLNGMPLLGHAGGGDRLEIRGGEIFGFENVDFLDETGNFAFDGSLSGNLTFEFHPIPASWWYLQD